MRERPGPPKGSQRTIRIDVQYDGTNYVGWQRQPKGKSIQGLLESALSKISSEKVTLFGSSRTDAGVHALGQVASFSLKKTKVPVHAFKEGTNSMLPPDIRVTRAEEVDLEFLANHAVKHKSYRYFIWPKKEPFVFLNRYAWQVPGTLNVDWMKEATTHIVGEHDFSAFRASGSDTKTSVRTIYGASWQESELDLLYFEIKSNGFLKYMVRAIVGTLVEIGLGKRKPEEMKSILESKNRIRAGRNAPPHGLFLWHVEF